MSPKILIMRNISNKTVKFGYNTEITAEFNFVNTAYIYKYNRFRNEKCFGAIFTFGGPNVLLLIYRNGNDKTV